MGPFSRRPAPALPPRDHLHCAPCATTEAVTFGGEHSGRMHFPLAAVVRAAEIARDTLRVEFDPTAPGVRVMRVRENVDAMDFSVRADPASVRFVVGPVDAGGAAAAV